MYAVIGGTDDVGTTTTAAALGASLAEGPRRVAVIDADLGRSTLSGALGLSVDGPTIESVLGGRATLLDATYERSRGLAVVPGDPDRKRYRDANLRILADVVEVARKRYDAVLLDVGAGDRPAAMAWAARADRTLLVSTLDEESLAATAQARQAVEYVGTPVAGVVTTRVDAGGTPDLAAIERRLSAPVLAALPRDEAAVTSVAAGAPVIEHAPDSPTAAAYWELAAHLAADDLPTDPVVPSPLSDGFDDGRVVDPDASTAAADGTANEPADDAAPTGTAEDDDAFDWVGGDDADAVDDHAEDSGAADDDAAGRTVGGPEAVATAADGSRTGGTDPTADTPGEGPESTGDEAAADEEDEVAAAFKETMDRVREEREAERDDAVDGDGLLGRLFD